MLKRSPAAAGACGLLLAVTGVALAVPSAAATPSGTPLTFGSNGFGQLGDGSASTTVRTTPGPVTGLNDVIQVAGGREHVLALRSDGTVAAWGSNAKGQIGDGTTATSRPEPVSVTGLGAITQVSTGHYHSLARRSDGTAWVWGYNGLGQLGDGTTTNRRVPQRFGTFTTVAQVAGGRDMSYVRLADGTVWCAGSNASGECGDGTTTARRTPVQVEGLTDVVDVAGGRNHGLALRSDGTVWAWGLNSSGQLGDGTTTTRTSPVQARGLTDVAEVAAGADHSIAVKTDGTVWVWGENFRGDLGLGDTSDRSTPTRVPGITDAKAVEAGRDHTMVVTDTGSLYVWGWNEFGQAGDPSLQNVLSPRLVPGVSNAISVGGGQAYTVVLTGTVDPDTSPPTAPGKPLATSTAPGVVDLSWDAASDDRATSLTYRVRRSGQGIASDIGSVRSSAATVTFTDSTATPGASYTYTVTADDGTNVGPASPESDPVTVASGSATVWQDGFANGFTAWSNVTRVTLDSTLFPTSGSAPSARVAAAGVSASAWRSLPTPLGQVCTTTALRVESLGTATSVLRVRSSTGTAIARLIVGTDRKLRVRSDVAAITRVTSVVVPLASWQRVGLCVTVAGTSGTLSATYNGNPAGTWTLNTGTTAAGRVQIGSAGPVTATFNLDDVSVTTG
ncbi:MAG: hypothetical protein WAN48_16010 [Actinomycetes bacterium]